MLTAAGTCLAAKNAVPSKRKAPSVFNENDALPAIARRLASANDEELSNLIAQLGQRYATRKNYEEAGQVFDQLMARGELRSSIMAGSLLLAIINQVELSNYAATKDIREFPDALCERAARLLAQPEPVVQALGDWTLALRVKNQGSTAKQLNQHFQRNPNPPAWYRIWKERGSQKDLQDDYARQLIVMGRHWSLAGVREAIERTAARMAKLAADPATTPAPKAQAAYATALANARTAAAGAALGQGQAAYLALRLAARELVVSSRSDFPSEGLVFCTNPTIFGGNWNVNVPVIADSALPFGDCYRKRCADPALAAEPLLRGRLGDGSIRGMDLVWEANKLLFSLWHQPINGAQFASKNARLYEMDLTSGAIVPLTDAPGYNDIEPCFLPDGGYVFASDRSSFGNQCAGPILQNKRCTTLYRLDPKRADKPVAISNNKDFDRHPAVLNSGNIVFLHWEYQERGLYSSHVAWRCRPDGSNMDAYYKQHISLPYSIRCVRQVPNSDLHVATVQGHHSGENGALILFNPSRGPNNQEAMWLVSPGVTPIEGGLGPLARQLVPEGGLENRGGSFIHPFPMSEKAFLVGNDLTPHKSDFALYYVDVWGNRELLHRDKDMSCFVPMALRPRQRPPVVADIVKREMTYATAFVEDVYRDLPGVTKGTVKFLRVSQSLMLPAPVYREDSAWNYNHLHFLPGDATARHFGYWLWSPSRTVGLVRVGNDGSAFFKVPAGTPIYLQALDANYCEIRRMRTSFTLQRGEFRGCTGCHESRLETGRTRQAYSSALLASGPQTPVPPTWGENAVLDFRLHIQPIFDAHCVTCHGEKKPDGGIELTAREIGGFSQSYRALFGLKPADPTPIKELDWHLVLEPQAQGVAYITGKEADAILKQMQANQWPGQLVAISDRQGDSSITQPLQFGSNKSRLIRVLLDDAKVHQSVRAKMPAEQWLALVTWVDYNATYHSTVFDVRHYAKTKTFTRVPVALPSPWEPADLGPSFLNVAHHLEARAGETGAPASKKPKSR